MAPTRPSAARASVPIRQEMLELFEDRCVAEEEQPIPSSQLEGGGRVGSAHAAAVHGEDARTGPIVNFLKIKCFKHVLERS